MSADLSANIAESIQGYEMYLASGVQLVGTAADKERIGPAGRERFVSALETVVRSNCVNMATSIVNGPNILRNSIRNIEAYALSDGVLDLKDSRKGEPAVCVAAGPSLSRNVSLLKLERVQQRCTIIAVQTVLKLLLAKGIRPHYVTAVDYSEISGRFYEGLTEEAVDGIDLVAISGAAPAIFEGWPGRVRCPASGTLDLLLGPDFAKERGELRGAATVAHLSYYLARYMGCNPVILIGQDLGFTDGHYYSAGATVHDVWSSELNEFRTLEMCEHERVMTAPGLTPAVDQDGRPMYTDRQMEAYRVQFERDFGIDQSWGLTTYDCTEGGVAKAGTVAAPLRDVLSAWGCYPYPRTQPVEMDRAAQ